MLRKTGLASSGAGSTPPWEGAYKITQPFARALGKKVSPNAWTTLTNSMQQDDWRVGESLGSASPLRFSYLLLLLQVGATSQDIFSLEGPRFVNEIPRN